MRIGRLMILIAILCGLMSVPFQCRSPQERIYLARAVRHEELAADFRAAAQRALKAGNLPEAERLLAKADALERQGAIYRRAAGHRWSWLYR